MSSRRCLHVNGAGASALPGGVVAAGRPSTVLATTQHTLSPVCPRATPGRPSPKRTAPPAPPSRNSPTPMTRGCAQDSRPCRFGSTVARIAVVADPLDRGLSATRAWRRSGRSSLSTQLCCEPAGRPVPVALARRDRGTSRPRSRRHGCGGPPRALPSRAGCAVGAARPRRCRSGRRPAGAPGRGMAQAGSARYAAGKLSLTARPRSAGPSASTNSAHTSAAETSATRAA